MCKKIAVAAALSAMLSGCGDEGVDAPVYVENAQGKIEFQLENYAGISLPCYRQQFENRWFVLCFDRDNSGVGPRLLYEVVGAEKSPYGYIIQPVNGKASQYGDRFNPNYAEGAYDAIFAPKVDISAVLDLFRKTYPPKKS